MGVGVGSTVRRVALLFVWVRTVGLCTFLFINMQGKGAEAQRAGGGRERGGVVVQLPPNTGYG